MIKIYSGSTLWHLALALAAVTFALVPAPLLAADEANVNELIEERCQACHKQLDGGGGLRRIAEARRTPEGWDMTVARMIQLRRTSLTPVERRAIVKYLAGTYGLAPEETAPWRYALERRPEATDFVEDEMVGTSCAICHSYARIALQRRSEDDWARLPHFHVGQFTMPEYAGNNRSYNWWEVVSQQLPKVLAKRYPLESEAWENWKKQPKMNPAGAWRIVGHRPGWGDYEGVATVSEKKVDEYALTLELNYANGKTQKGSGDAIVYTNYEWRGSVTLGDEEVRQIFTLSDGGAHMQGYWHQTDVGSLGGDLRGAKLDGKAEILAIAPAYMKAGSTQQITIHGVGLTGEVSIDGGAKVTRVLSRSPDKMVVEVATSAATARGLHDLKVGDAVGRGLLNVYKQIDLVRVVPGPALSRVGGNGGKLPAFPVQFEAIAYAAGKDGKAGTADDVRIGVFPARWSLDNLNPTAAALRDLTFAGTIDTDNGLFTPGPAGPNPKRKFGGNNAGELKVMAAVEDGKRKVKGATQLIVTTQRWNDPPIR